jgi:putative SOS response-associated peptidase YedK
MCNLVTLNTSTDEVASHFKARRPKATNASTGEVYPGGQGFIVRSDAGERVVQAMTWGFPVRLKGMKPTSKPKPVNNARDDKLLMPFLADLLADPGGPNLRPPIHLPWHMGLA